MTEQPFDPVLINRTDPQQEAEWLVTHVGETGDIANQLRRLTEEKVSQLAGRMQPGDELWHTQSRFLGPLAGWYGVALVRDGTIIERIVLLNR